MAMAALVRQARLRDGWRTYARQRSSSPVKLRAHSGAGSPCASDDAPGRAAPRTRRVQRRARLLVTLMRRWPVLEDLALAFGVHRLAATVEFGVAVPFGRGEVDDGAPATIDATNKALGSTSTCPSTTTAGVGSDLRDHRPAPSSRSVSRCRAHPCRPWRTAHARRHAGRSTGRPRCPGSRAAGRRGCCGRW